MKKINLKNVVFNLNKFNKIIVTGPPRSGTTISAMIIANILKYKFIDESWYDGNNVEKFINLFKIPRKMVIQTTAFLRDLHTINKFAETYKIAIILIKRDIKEILDSFKNTENFTIKIPQKDGTLMDKIGDEELEILFNHYGYKYKDNNKSLPEIIYNHFDNHKNFISKNRLFFMKYPADFRKHKLYIPKKERRANFQHIKQVKLDDPYYLKNQKGIMVL